MKKIMEKFKNVFTNKKNIEFLFLAIIIGITVFTRFCNLGYSDYIGDEHKAFIELRDDQTLNDFFMSKRKGPMQFLVAHIPYLITGDFRNELAQRIPFSFISVAAILVFYFVVKKFTKNYHVAFLAALLLSINGFIVGFGRIAQYQNLNLLFSFLALYFYADLLNNEKTESYLKSSLLGTLFWCLSFLSHWDAIFILPVVLIIFIRLLQNEDFIKEKRQKLILFNLILGSLVLLPFLLPYIRYQAGYQENINYFDRRIELGHFNLLRYKLLADLYNPFVTFYALGFLGLLGTFLIKRSYIFTTWFLFSYLLFELFVRKPGTHIYNFVIPLTILSALAICSIYKVLPKYLKKVWVVVILIFLVFLTYQTCCIFIDHKKEYPWEQKTLMDFHGIEEKIYEKIKVKTKDRVHHSIVTPKYSMDQKLPLFGFPHKRYWNEINDFINEENEKNVEDFRYMTNEVKTISEWYMDAKHSLDRPFYLIGVRKPLSFSNDYKYPQIGRKKIVQRIENEFGNEIVRIYRVERR